MKFLLFTVTFCISFYAHSKILVLEHYDKETNYNKTHGKQVTQIACPGLKENCLNIYSDHLIYNYSYSIESKLFFEDVSSALHESQVVNMSLALQSPSRVPEKVLEQGEKGRLTAALLKKIKDRQLAIKKFPQQKNGLEDLITSHQHHLFVIAAGNGYYFDNLGLRSNGVGISAKYNKIYPAIFNFDNTIKVTAIDKTGRLALYSNYSLESIDIAASIPDNTYELSGTSYATPVISDLADTILTLYPNYSPRDVKEIIMKSADVAAIDQALAATENFIENGKDSKTYKAQFERKRKKRIQFQKELGPILLVKSGGVVNTKLALECAFRAYNNIYYKNITEACLSTHKDMASKDETYTTKLSKLWQLRGF